MALTDLDNPLDAMGPKPDLEIGHAVPGSGGSIVIDDRFTIAPDNRIPELDSPETEAYGCRDSEDPHSSVFALVSTTLMPARIDELPSFRRLERVAMLTPKAWAVIDWPYAEGTNELRRRFALVLERPGGRRLMQDEKDQIRPFTEDRLTRFIIRPMLPVLRALNEIGLGHRAIRPSNFFFQDAVTGEVVLGEGFMGLPGYHSPIAYETVGNGMAELGGRGATGISEDLYALGVTLAFLLLGRNTISHLSDEEITRQKLDQGTYATIIQDSRIPLAMMEPLRGLLADDRNERWTLHDLDMWVSGRRLSPKQPKLLPRAVRPFNFDLADYFTTPTLAQAFYNNWSAATKSIGSDPIDTWLRRGLGSDEMANSFTSAIRTAAAYGGREGVEDRMVARAITVLDTSGPLRFRTLSTRLNALPSMLAARFVTNQEIKDVNVMVNAKLAHFWLDLQPQQRAEHQIMRRQLDLMAHMHSRGGPGYGMERALYELHTACPCLSAIVDKHYVLDIKDLLPALNEAAIEREMYGEPMDRHIAAFIAARLRSSVDGYLQKLGMVNDEAERRMAMVRLLAEVQQQVGGPSQPELAKWVVRISAPIIESYHSKNFRERLSKDVKKIAERGGTLMDIAYALENTTRRERDNEGFTAAMTEYAEAEAEIARIDAGEMTNVELIERRGQELAALLSAGSAVILLLSMVIWHLVTLLIESGLGSF